MALRKPVNYTAPYDVTSLIAWQGKRVIEGACACAYLVSAVGNITVAVTSRRGGLANVPGYPGVTFLHTVGLLISKVQHPADTEPSNSEADCLINAAGLTEADIEAGKWDHGACTLFTTNGDDPRMGQLIIQKGFFSKFEKVGPRYRVELRGLNEALNQTIGKYTEELCDADYGDARCGLNLVARGEIHNGTLTSVSNAYTFRDTSRTEGVEYFDNASGVWTNGLNNGFPFHVDRWASGTKEFKLRTAAPFLPVPGDTYTVKRGCKKRKVPDCLDRLNVINFRGTPDVPTSTEFVALPSQPNA